MYSLVSAPVFGFDLVRLRTGAATAGVLLDALSLDPQAEDVQSDAVLSIADPDDAVRAMAWFELAALPRPSSISETLELLRGGSADSGEGLSAVASGLAVASVGGLDDLIRVMRTDILGWAEPPLVTMACDALAAAYSGPALSREASRRLAAPWLQVVRELKASPPDLGPESVALNILLDRCRRLDAEEQRRLEETPAIRSWANCVNDATWAAFLADRLRPVASAQLMLVRELQRAGVGAEAAARGVWNAVSGCVQAVAVRDLLCDATYEALTSTWRDVVGPLA